MAKMSTLDWIALILVVIGALNWGLYGLMKMDLVAVLLGGIPILATLVYVIVALSGLWLIYNALTAKK